MFKLITLEDTIRIPPEKFGEPIEEVGHDQLGIRYEGMVDEELGYVIAVTDIQVNPVGKIIPGDGATYHKALFSLLTFLPKIQEIVEGEVVEIADFGAFIRMGPIDALLHVSQLMDDYISYDEKQGVLMGRETRRKLSTGDQVRVRVTAVSLGRGGSSGKVGVTARQPFLGKIEWINREVEKLRTAETEKPKKPAKSLIKQQKA
ncbi:DNA-directed RNA polymerase [Candidatus Bathyarchaeota archaeon]|jgi:DNA-directed RNA polymerase subunit E'|nr:DNA-directed RNA polymerase [Candidatus Bathyarchaeota archaeon]NIV44801.1 DNA-directed RNA polymerase [Candidatus Bathyarchaeota archaeon]UCC28367.1 MAG: DNA-directed RNA polymerase [Candidatus Bathyarchaeota archaeon]UCD40033.1 MAG: DNA-directed RNA polymerase [Candidatus Bathyarchaeota archaeon]